MKRFRALPWLEVIGLVLIVVWAFLEFGVGWALLAAGVSLLIVGVGAE